MTQRPPAHGGRHVPLDWDGARGRLKAARERLEAIDQSIGDFEARLHARAEAIATALAAPPPRGVADLVVFRIGVERYAVDALEVLEVIEIAHLTALPGVPAFYRGLVTRGGVVFPLVDLRPLLGRAAASGPPFARAILYRSEAAAVALGAEDVETLLRLDADAIRAMPGSGGDRRAAAVRGITSDGIVVVDAWRLLADARLVVDDRSSAADGSAGS